jgi:O-antigen ligase
MGRFLSNKPIPSAAAAPALAGGPVLTAAPASGTATRVSRASLRSTPSPKIQTEETSAFQRLGVYAYYGVALSTTANDLMLHLVGEKAYLYWLSFPAAILLLLICGTGLRGLRTTVGRMWLAFGVWMILGVPTSFWPGGSVAVLRSYLPRIHLLFFLITAFFITRRQCRQLMTFNVFSAFLMLLICIGFGGTPSDTGRFCIPGSVYFTNPNELAIELLTAIGALTYWLFDEKKIKIAAAILGIALSLFFVLKTGSRGALLASAVLLVMAFFITQAKAPILAFVVLSLLFIPLLPSNTLHRLTLIVFDTDAPVEATNTEDTANIDSQIERQTLFRKSIELTFSHPILGVGVDMFIDATSGADAKKGVHSAALGTHNSYTQISSETGLPGFLLYAGALVLSLSYMIKLYRATSNRPELRDFTAMSYSTWISIAGFGLSSMFHHLGYAPYVATLCGTAMVIHMAAQPYLRRP